MKLRWFLSSQYRETSDVLDHVEKLRNAQCDILAPESLASLDAIILETRTAMDTGAGDEILSHLSETLANAAHKWLKPYPDAEWRDNVEVLLVAVAVAMAVRTFFIQPFKIPTGSMQPTLFGVTVEDLHDKPDFVMPGFFTRLYDLAVKGAIYHRIIAQDDGEYDHSDPAVSYMHVINRQTIWVRYHGGAGEPVPITIWGGPDNNSNESFEHSAGLWTHASFKKGEPIVQFVETTGDHLFVDRVTYNFRHPRRGEIIVFKTGQIPQIGADQFYIKRLIGLPGETISIGIDRHVRIDGRRLDATTPHFENLYGFDPYGDAHESRLLTDTNYSGHVFAHLTDHAILKGPADKLRVRAGHYAVFGDNTANSWDSRYWGDFPQESVVGKAWFVYWPITYRFGWGQR